MKKDDLFYLKMALIQAKDSPDPSTQNGAIIIDDEGWVLGEGCNRFPDRVEYKEERWERPIKYSYIEHAERNAIFNAARFGEQVYGSTLYCPWYACADCARAIIQSGISRCFGLSAKENTNPRWQETINVAMGMLKEAGVQCDFTDHKFGIQLRRDGELMEF